MVKKFADVKTMEQAVKHVVVGKISCPINDPSEIVGVLDYVRDYTDGIVGYGDVVEDATVHLYEKVPEHTTAKKYIEYLLRMEVTIPVSRSQEGEVAAVLDYIQQYGEAKVESVEIVEVEV